MQIHLESGTLRREALGLTFHDAAVERADRRLAGAPAAPAAALRRAVNALHPSAKWEWAAWMGLAIGSASALVLSFCL
jgi:hypothetical protein